MIAARVAPAIAWLARVGGPVVWLLDKSSAAVLRLFGLHRAARQTVTEEELKALLAEGAQAGVLETEERDMIERVLRLADKPVRAIMTPRTEIAWIDRTDPPKEIAATLKSAPHSRFVVCDGSVDNVVGVVQAKDILDRILDGGELSLAAALRQPMVVPDTVTALDALERLKSGPARAGAGDGRVRQLRGRGDGGRRAGGDRRRSDAMPSRSRAARKATARARW